MDQIEVHLFLPMRVSIKRDYPNHVQLLRGVHVQNTYFGETVWLFCVLLLLTMLGRAAFVFPFSFLHNWWSRNEQLTIKEMVVIWCAYPGCSFVHCR